MCMPTLHFAHVHDVAIERLPLVTRWDVSDLISNMILSSAKV